MEPLKPIERTLTDYGKLGVMALRKDVQKVSATGKTADSIRFEISSGSNGEITLQILGRQFFKALETGRGPRKSSTYGQFDLNLDEYLKARGLPTKTSKSGVVYYQMGEYWFSAKSLAWKINKYGDSIFRQGGREVYSQTLVKLAREIKSAIVSVFPKLFIREVLVR